ncbi:MAG: sulfate reduction electron transfer complex DsrMKJOP subunit DsrM [Syntrophales bacterium LBB04]|nr:sulfate reduction electron transfer complex DsrMKJOP subunit DsrM [Syntrophales bacterium LBB04]
MKVIVPFSAVILLALIGYAGSQVAPYLFGVVIPYLALAAFIGGIVWRVVKWAGSPVPFRIPTTAGQQKSLPWIKDATYDNPSTSIGVIGRMLMEVMLFRSLFRNTRMELKNDRNLAYSQEIFLWGAALVFHYSFLVIFLRHFRFFMEPVPLFVPLIQDVDGFLEIGVPNLYMTDLALLGAVAYLFFRRIYYPEMRYISLANDYFPLFLILGIGFSGALMRHFFKVDLLGVKELALGLFRLKPVLPAGIGAPFFIHLFLVSCLISYFPFSKLAHMAGIFLSPTRNLANTSRMKRHINPWNYPVKVHTYQEWEEEFHDLIKDCGLPLDKEEGNV